MGEKKEEEEGEGLLITLALKGGLDRTSLEPHLRPSFLFASPTKGRIEKGGERFPPPSPLLAMPGGKTLSFGKGGGTEEGLLDQQIAPLLDGRRGGRVSAFIL